MEASIDANSEIPTTHFFVYKEKKYPFNFYLFKVFSQYFNSIEPDENNINLFHDDTNIYEASIPDFIKFCHAQKITLTKDNTPSLYKLSQKFKVPSLFNKTKEYISTHQKEVVIEMMTMYHNDNNFQTKEFEEIISKDLINYLNDDRLITLPIPILHRIVTQYAINFRNKGNPNDSEQQQKLIEFLFKCLDHFGYRASVLFEHVDLLGSGGNVINRLFDGYSEKFDFHFVSANSAKTVYKLESEIIDREKSMEEKISESQMEVKSVSQMVKDEIEKMRKLNEEEMKVKNEMIKNIPMIIAQEIEKMKKQHEEEMRAKNELIEKLVKQIEDMQAKHQEEVRRQHDDLEGRMNQINKKLDRVNHSTCMLTNELDPNGIIAILGEKVALSAGGDNHRGFPLSNIRKYDNSLFYNWDNIMPKSESDGFIMFDFGPSKKIDLYSYFIRSNHHSPSGSFHPKT